MAVDHFEKHFYKKDRVDWNFNLTFEDQPDVAKMVQKYAQILNHPGLYAPVPIRWLHSTILRVGLVEDFKESEMLEVAGLLQKSLAVLDLPQFTFDHGVLWDGSVVLHISPDDEFIKLYNQVIKALGSVVGSDRIIYPAYGSYIPHTTLAYSKAHNSEHEIQQLLIDNPIKTASFEARHMPLIKQWPTAGHYEWEVIQDITVGLQKS